jgi:hypothetical protein
MVLARKSRRVDGMNPGSDGGLAKIVTTVTVVNMASPRWILLSSRIPREPTRLRLAAWRRLRRLGAVLLHDSIWILPAGDRTRESFEWLAQEITEQGGSALLWEASSLGSEQDTELVARFVGEADDRYRQIAAAAREALRVATRARKKAPLTQPVRRLRVLERALRLERRRDWFRAPGWNDAERELHLALRQIGELRDQQEKGGD